MYIYLHIYIYIYLHISLHNVHSQYKFSFVLILSYLIRCVVESSICFVICIYTYIHVYKHIYMYTHPMYTRIRYLCLSFTYVCVSRYVLRLCILLVCLWIAFDIVCDLFCNVDVGYIKNYLFSLFLVKL
jgi:hypothetical protein